MPAARTKSTIAYPMRILPSNFIIMKMGISDRRMRKGSRSSCTIKKYDISATITIILVTIKGRICIPFLGLPLISPLSNLVSNKLSSVFLIFF
jgi:hypothetical protein